MMSFAEKQLRTWFESSVIIKDAVFCGTKMVGVIGSDTRAKIEFASTRVQRQYNAIRVTILNRREGVIDTTTFGFLDIIGPKNNYDPHIWDSEHSQAWYGFTPSHLENTLIANKVLQYIKLFADNM